MRIGSRRLLSALLCGSLLALACSSPIATAQTTITHAWTWMGGGSVLSNCPPTNGTSACGQPGEYGNLGQPNSGNIPGGRTDPQTWIDKDGNFWLFGGWGFDANGNLGNLNDLWEFNPSKNEWTWMGGSSIEDSNDGQPGVYGSLGKPATGNIPGSRSAGLTWTDSAGNFWLFGGYGRDSNDAIGILNDLWKFNPSTQEWAWMSGSDTVETGCLWTNYCGQQGVYGTLGIPAAVNVPKGRWSPVGWISGGDLWLFGGIGPSDTVMTSSLNDLWRFNPSSMEWTWMGGSNSYNGESVYGAIGIPASGNIPGPRFYSSSWTDSNGKFWLFGGTKYQTASLKELWRFNPSSKEWTFVDGSTVPDPIHVAPSGIYGTLGMPAPDNVPGGRWLASTWTDGSGNFWLFGGWGNDAMGFGGTLNDLWEFNPSTNEWTWIAGNSSVVSGNTDSNLGCIDYDFPCGKPGIYGSMGVPAPANNPGARNSAASWTDKNGNLWLFGGYVFDANGNSGWLNDMWKYQPATINLPVATPTFSVPAGRYTSALSISITDATPGTSIYYTIGGGTPNTRSTLYTGPINMTSTESDDPMHQSSSITINAIAVLNGSVESLIGSATYRISPPPDFTISASPSQANYYTGSKNSGAQTPETIAVTLLNGFDSTITFSCSGLPAGATYSFSPSPFTPSAISTNVVLTITSPIHTSVLSPSSGPLFPASLLAMAFLCFGWNKRKHLQVFLLLSVSVAVFGLLTSCGGGSGSSTGGGGGSQSATSTVTVTATSGSITHSTTFTLTTITVN